MSFVFISHASEDKARLRRIIDTLLDAKIKIWLDDPIAAGYSPEDTRLHRLHAGERWDNEIDEALRRSDCVLFCLSSGFHFGRKTWHREVTAASVFRKLVGCRIDNTSPEELPSEFRPEQLPCVDPDQPIDVWEKRMLSLVADIRRKLDHFDGPKGHARSDLELPLYADRKDHEAACYRAVEAANGGGVVPIAVKGPRNELPDEFVARVERRSATMRDDGAIWFRVRVEWPTAAHSKATFEKTYRQALWSELELQLDPGVERKADNYDQRIAEYLAERQLTAVFHRINPKHWRRREEPELIRAWMDYWASLNERGSKLKVVPILVVPFPAAKPGWRDYPRVNTGGRVGVKEIWETIRGFAGSDRNASGLSLTLPPFLAPIRDDHAEAWMLAELDHLDPECRSKIEEEIGKLYGNGRARKHGIPHHDFHEALKSLCAGARTA